MLLIKTYYYIFYAFIYLLAGFCDLLHAVYSRKGSLRWKRTPSLKNHYLPLLRLHHGVGHS